jgi:hypothetical protein
MQNLDSQVKSQIAAFIARYSPDVARQFRSARATLRRLFPRGYELVYDNYNALGCGFSPTPRSSGILVSVVAYPKWVTLFFFNGRRLSDPDRLLQGSGTKIRSIRLQPFALLKSEAVGSLLAQAIEDSRSELTAAPRLSTVVKSVSARQRPRRPQVAKSKVAQRRARALE